MSKYIYIAAMLLVSLALLYGHLSKDNTPDAQLITALVSDATRAANMRSLSGCMSHISEDFTAESSINKDQFRMLVAQAFRSELYFNMQTYIKELRIEDESASAVVDVVIMRWESGTTLYRRDVYVDFIKEPGRRLLVFPASVWRALHIDTLVVDEGEQMFF